MDIIKTKADLKRVLKVEKEKLNIKRPFIMRITYSEGYRVYRFFKNLRYLEYYLNKKKFLWDYIPLAWRYWNHRRMKLKYSFYIHPNTLDEGFHLVHSGFVRVAVFAKIGKNCTVLPRVLIGKKKPGIDNPEVNIGDNCYIGTGVTILGPINIGNNVTIAAGSVVTQDVPDNCIIGGIPAKVLKHKNPAEASPTEVPMEALKK
ncbi:serine acetyltransferase [Echinicola strongylocentroti]|uniref:Serine acetyltransferase n=1 Tax=Echinicola strongylocentroti TaxID=1795355 RepID=A0A2Z4IN44_9BACT|nr:serine acetyltransferase [Echinicola strongylocentroti]AWW32522.1 serine acetyltransferase [Echinicola strongylocentroti]